MAVKQRLGDRGGFANALGDLALVQLERGEGDTAVSTLLRTLGLCREVGERRLTARTPRYLVSAHLLAGRTCGSPRRATRTASASRWPGPTLAT